MGKRSIARTVWLFQLRFLRRATSRDFTGSSYPGSRRRFLQTRHSARGGNSSCVWCCTCIDFTSRLWNIFCWFDDSSSDRTFLQIFRMLDSRLNKFNAFLLLGKDEVESLRRESLLLSRGVRRISALFSRVIRSCSSLLSPLPVLLLSFRGGEELFGFLSNDFGCTIIPAGEGASLPLSLLTLPFFIRGSSW